MPDSLFYLLLVGVAGAWLFGVMRRRRALLNGLPGGASGLKRGPVPGYTYLPGRALRFDPADPLQTGLGEWAPRSLETLHAGARTRVVLTVDVTEALDDTGLFTLFKSLATRLQRRTQAAVVAVRLEREDGLADGALVYAPDGRGWTGTTRGAELTAELPGRGPFRLSR